MWQFALENAAVSTLLAALVWLVCRFIRRPAVVHGLWLIVLLKLITPPLLLIPLQGVPTNCGSPMDSVDDNRAVDAPAEVLNGQSAGPSAPRTANSWIPAEVTAQLNVPRVNCPSDLAAVPSRGDESSWNWGLAIFWLAGSTWWFLRRFRAALRFSELVADAIPAPLELQQRADRLARRLGLPRAPAVRIVPATISPMLWGLGSRTQLLFPTGLLTRLDPESCDTLLVHEIAHFRRRDHLVRLLELLISGLYWWHPVVWWVRRELEASEEKCCDAWVVTHFAASPRRYAEALLATLDFLATAPARKLPPIATGIGDVPLLRERLTEIMRGPPEPQIPASGRCGLLTTAAAVLCISPSLTFRDSGSVDISPQSLANKMPSVTEQPATPGALGGIDRRPVLDQTDAIEATVLGNVVAGGLLDESGTIFPDQFRVSSPEKDSTVTRENSGRLIWRLPSKAEIDLTSLGVSAVAFSPDGAYLATCGSDCLVRCWEVTSGQLIHELKGHKDCVQTLAFSPAGMLLASGSRDGEVVLWNLYHWRSVGRLISQNLPVSALAMSNDGWSLGAALGSEGGHSGRLLVFDLGSWQTRFEMPTDQGLAAVVFREDGGRLAAGDWSGLWTTWDLNSGRPVGEPQRLPRAVGDLIRFSSEPDVFAQVGLISELQAKRRSGETSVDAEIPPGPNAPAVPPSPAQAG